MALLCGRDHIRFDADKWMGVKEIQGIAAQESRAPFFSVNPDSGRAVKY
jgi:hypothetical protein